MSQELLKSIESAWEKFIEHEEHSAPSNRNNCYASGYEPCTRKLVFQMTHGDQVAPFPTEVKAKFRRGKDRERNTILDMQLVGRYSDPSFDVIAQQKRFALKDHKGRVAISGKVDLMLDYGRDQQSVPCELKDFHSSITDRIDSFDDVLRGKWTHKAARQLLCYLFGEGVEFGILVFTRPGLPKLIPVYLSSHLDLVEEFLNKAEDALDHKEAGTFPDFIQDVEECKRCYFYGGICNPPIASGEGAKIFTDPEIEQKLLRMVELEPAADEYASIETWAKKAMRGVEIGMAGSALIQGKWQQNTTYPVTEEVKKQIKELQKPFEKVDERGKFFLTVSKV